MWDDFVIVGSLTLVIAIIVSVFGVRYAMKHDQPKH
jgi:hypothetical protein